MKRRIVVSLMIVCFLVLTACAQSGGVSKQESATTDIAPTASASKKAINLKSADTVAATSPYTIGMNELTAEIKKATNDRIQIKHFPGGQLGKDLEIVEGVKLGSIDMGLVGNVASKATDAFYLPFLFEDSEHMNKVLNGPIGEKIKLRVEKETGLKLIGYVYFAPRVLTTKGKEVLTPKELKGLKIRVPEIPLMVDTWKALGATPTPIAFTELFSSLQTGVVIGQENPYEIISNNSFFEVQDTLIETYHSIPVRFLIMNKKKYDSLTPEDQKLLTSTWAKTSANIEKLYKGQDETYIQKLKEHGMKFIKPDVNAFREATKDIWKKYAPDAWGEGVYEEIQALRKNK